MIRWWGSEGLEGFSATCGWAALVFVGLFLAMGFQNEAAKERVRFGLPSYQEEVRSSNKAHCLVTTGGGITFAAMELRPESLSGGESRRLITLMDGSEIVVRNATIQGCRY